MPILDQRATGKAQISFPFTFTTKYLHALRKNGPLAVTDANLMLGRLIVDYFPKIFGKSENEPLDIEASRVKFKEIAKTVNAEGNFEKQLSLDEVVYGFIKIANETMCRPIRALTEARGYATSSHMCVIHITSSIFRPSADL